ncbi:type III secretion protein L [Sinorhizobium terangae]|uniref:Type 3 secretion system stator protein n=1 Tax=Sinorhizobium terangae TaxID=110322 RepID=A0A6N7LLU3_SINTE|nr:type III secretion system stator protein SctL [Sinorhizobium terangae]MBB4189200.1 type III secretion protein L [Sinorhizobium terangae]MQX18270.1 HrpE/YscL family type III secretion apparatus protein [Sinorhizobium terangae]
MHERRRRSRVIPAHEFGVISEAAALVAAAREVVAIETAKASEVRETAREDGYRQGYAEGLRKATESFAAAAAKAEKALFDIEGLVTPIVLRAVERIVGSLDADERVGRLVTQAIGEVAESQRVTLHVAAGEAAAVRKAIEGLDRRIDVVADQFLSAGEIVMETSMSRAHIGAREQIAALMEAAGHG